MARRLNGRGDSDRLLLKKGKGEKVEEFRGVMLTQMAYKVYTWMLAERLRKEVKEKNLLPPNHKV